MNYYEEIKNKLIDNEINKNIKTYSINRSELNTYYEVGKILSKAGKHYGEGIIKEYSKKLKNDLNKNYSVRLLYKMLKYYNFITNENLPTLSAKLSWSHYDEILRFNDINKIIYYINTCNNYNLTIRELRERIKSQEYERLPIRAKNKIIHKKETTLIEIIKNPIIIKNHSKLTNISEKLAICCNIRCMKLKTVKKY